MPPDAVPADEPNQEEKMEELPGDDQTTPFRPADDATYLDDQAAMSIKSLSPTDGEEEEDDQVIHDTTAVQPDVGDLSSTHPQTDTNLERSEYYDEGISGAAEAGEPNADNQVTGYHKPNDGADAEPGA